MKWEIVYEVRELGAIGVFWLLKDTILAPTKEAAKELFRATYQDKFEFRACYKCELAI